MKLTFNNFRWYEDGGIELPDDGLTLLSGESGVGKSTILEAILYALFSLREPYTRGSKTCYVTLEWRGMFIRRSSKAPVLRLKDLESGVIYKNNDAQNIIYSKLGVAGSNEFIYSSYIRQKSRLSILTLTPAEQLKFIETLVFEDDSHEKNMIKFKENISEKNKLKVETECMIEVISKQLSCEIKSEDEEEIEEELKNQKSSDLIKQSVQIEKNISKNQEKFDKIKEKIDKFDNEKSDIDDLNKEKQKTEIEISQLNQRRTSLGKIPTESEVIKYEEEYELQKKLRDDTQAYNRYIEDKNKFGVVKENYFENLKIEIDELKKSSITPLKMAQLKKKISDFTSNQETYESELEEKQKLSIKKANAIAIFKEVGGYARKTLKFRGKKFSDLLKFFESKLIDFEKKIIISSEKLEEYEAEKEALYAFECPSCNTYLVFKDDSLEIASPEDDEDEEKDEAYFDDLIENESITNLSLKVTCDKVKDSIQKLKEVMPDFHIQIPKISSLNFEEVQKLQSQYNNYENIRKEISEKSNSFKNKILSPSLVEMEENLEALKTFDSSFITTSDKTKNIDEINETIESLISTIDDAQLKISDAGICDTTLKQKKNELRKIIGDLKQFEKNQKSWSVYMVQIQESSNLIQSLNADLNLIKTNIIKLQTYEAQNIQKEKINKLEKDLESNKNILVDQEKSLIAAYKLEEIAHLAEITAIENYIENINQAAKIYLDQLFDEEISVRLENYKTTSKGDIKPQINVEVEHENHIFNSISSLSGGEIQRCELAFMLAINDVTSSKILMLDECLNNLDANLNMKAVEFLKRRGIPTFVISHEAVEGTFTKVINVSKNKIQSERLKVHSL
ncbi:SMC family ATPase [bacterium]|nr:SMC family ATPase [bacterium]